MAIPISYTSHTEAGTSRPANGCVEVDIFRREFIWRYSSPSSELLKITRALFDAPLNELMRLHQLPPDSATLESFNMAMENLGNLDEDAKRRILCLIRQECNVLVAERQVQNVSPYRGMAIRIYADLCNPIPVPNDYEDEQEEEINATLDESFDEAFRSIRFRSAEEEAIEKLERFVFNDDDDDDDDDRETCAVCMDDKEPGERGARMPCDHVYHEYCIVKWLGVSGFCPICRFQLADQDDQLE